LFLDNGNAEHIVSKQKLTQPQAQQYCSKHNGTLHDFQSLVNIKLQKGEPYWAGLDKRNGKCVIAKMDAKNRPPVLHFLWCCRNLAYAICKSRKDGVALDTGNYCYFFLKLLISLLLHIEHNVSIHFRCYKEQRKIRGVMRDSNLKFRFSCL
jgi:hypothetical protein